MANTDKRQHVVFAQTVKLNIAHDHHIVRFRLKDRTVHHIFQLLLGRRFILSGRIVKGFSFAGGKLGHPTANLVPDSEILPPDGVYGAKVTLDGQDYLAAVNIGVAPSFEFNQHRRRVEVHLLEFEGNLYDREIEVNLLKYIRNERFFESAEALKAQIILDIQQIKSLK